MRSHGTLPRSALAACICAVVLAPARAAVADPPAIQFMANRGGWQDCSFTGHAFICITADGAEDCFGFFLDAGGKGMVFGPGCSDTGVNGRCADHTPVHFFRPSARLPKPRAITAAQRDAIVRVGADWNAKAPFTLDWQTAVAFANAVAAAAGLKPPSLTAETSPAGYVQALAMANPDDQPKPPSPAGR